MNMTDLISMVNTVQSVVGGNSTMPLFNVEQNTLLQEIEEEVAPSSNQNTQMKVRHDTEDEIEQRLSQMDLENDGDANEEVQP